MTVWTQRITQVEKQPKALRIWYEILRDGVGVEADVLETRQFHADPQLWVAQWLKARIEVLQALEAMPEPTIGDVTLPPDPVLPTEPTAAERAWQADFQKLKNIWPLVDAGIIPANNAKWVALKTRLANNFNSAYLRMD